MSSKIQIKRGAVSNIPTLLDGEFGYCTDTNQLYIGNNSVNKEIATKEQLDDKANKTEIEFPFSDGYKQASSEFASKVVKNALNQVTVYINCSPVSGNFIQNEALTIGTIPVGYRPSTTVAGTVHRRFNDTGYVYVDIFESGAVKLCAQGTVSMGLGMIIYDI